jgi:hypothetical protein
LVEEKLMGASPFDIVPAEMVAGGPIKELHVLMALEEIYPYDIQALAEQLSR